MIQRLKTRLPIRLLIVALLAMIGLHAAAPAGTPLELVRGSAFSATTFDVAVMREQQQQAVRRAVVLPQFDLPPQPELRLDHVRQPVTPRWRHERPNATGPPAEEILARQPPPRAPPLT